MKKVLLFASGLLFFGATQLQAQNWVNKGNTLTGNGIIGINSNHSLLFETNNSERGRITNNGLWGIGTGTTLPDAKFQINSITTRDPLRVQVDTKTKFLVHKEGGVSIGSNVTPPVDGLFVAGRVGIGPNSLSNDDFTITKLTIGKEDGVIYGISTTAEGTGLKTSGNFGVFAEGRNTGLYGNGGVYGVNGYSELGTAGVYGLGGYGNGGLFESSLSDGIRARTYNEGSYAGYFAGDVFATGIYQGSDKNIKKNIEEMGNATSLISQLKPKYYQFRNDGKYASLMLPKGNHYGLLAQDVEEVLPTLVKETLHEVKVQKPMAAPKLTADGQPDLSASSKEQVSKGPTEKISIKAVNYTELIPIMIKSMQEQQAAIEKQQTTVQQQQAKIEELTLLVQKLSQKDNSAVSIKATDAYLSYSNPNPNSVSARINYNLPSGATKAHLVITNATGQQLKKIILNNSGSVEVNTTTLSAGIYFYSLFIDDNLFETKKMVIAR